MEVDFAASWQPWAVIFEPKTFVWLMGGLGETLKVAFVSIVFSLTFGTLLAVLRLSGLRLLWLTTFTYTEGIRNLPLILIIFFTYFAGPKMGLDLSVYWAGVVAFTVFTSSLVAEIVRGGIQSIPKGQIEAARSSGMTYVQSMWYIVLPQALKKMIPPLVSQFVTLIKDTSYLYIINYPELTSRGTLIFIRDMNPLQVLFVVAVIYFLICYSLSIFGRRLEQRLATE